MNKLDGLSLGFRDKYLRHEELTKQLHLWAEAMPGVMHLESIAKSEQGRDIWLVTIGREPDRVRPAAWMDGNIHASEVAGSSACLAVIEDLLRAYAGESLVDLPDAIRDLLVADVLFYVLPRMCPDGAERVLDKRHFVRSNPRDHRMGNQGPYWRHDDVDGDGRSLLMRKLDPTGDFVESKDLPGLMLPREVEDEGPFYRIFPEGFIERFDGFTVPRPSYLSDSETDMNRNFPSMWQAEPTQLGAGAFPTSEPESRAVTEFAVRHPNIFVWLSMHTYGGVYIRPLADKPDSKMDPFDLAVFRQIERWGDAIAGYPTVSNFVEFTYEPDKPLYGDLANFAYAERGAIGFVCEIWDFFRQVGFEVVRPFIKNYEIRTTRADIRKIAEWDREHNAGRIIGTWKKVAHPQLGEVEIGGYDPLIGVWNPPYEKLPEVCDQQARFFFRLSAMAPRLVLSEVSVSRVDGETYRVHAIVENRGYLPTFVLGSAKCRPFTDPVRARIELGPGLELCAGPAEHELGHIAGWGGNDRSTTPALARSTSEPARRRVEWIVRGKGDISVMVSATRVGCVTEKASVG
ncbi:MAG: peptidase M14 [Myxococcales bacterium]|nr:peptidase M14 [Myxococcales bacterium]